MTPAIFGLAGPALTDDERAFFRDADPAGYILFARNVETRGQLRALTDDLRSIHGRDGLLDAFERLGESVLQELAAEQPQLRLPRRPWPPEPLRGDRRLQ